jgi:hypothetical protein
MGIIIDVLTYCLDLMFALKLLVRSNCQTIYTIDLEPIDSNRSLLFNISFCPAEVL